MRKSNAPSFLKLKTSSALRPSTGVQKLNTTSSVSSPSDGSSSARSTSHILSLLNSNTIAQSDDGKNETVSSHGNYNEPPVSDGTLEKITFEAYFRKMTTKKHKTWEGDGTVEIEGRCAILKDENGKELGRNSKVKADVKFEEGTQLLIGGKEVELGAVKNKQVIHRAPTPPLQPHVKKMKFRPQKKPEDFPLPKPSANHQWKYNQEGLTVNEVVVEGFLAKALRKHQLEGVTFLYECVMGMRGPDPGQYWGALLADEMGLGKTLQCIALIWTLLNQKMYGRGGEIRRVLIVSPRTLVDNWERDIYAWLGYRRMTVYKVDSKHSMQGYSKKLSKVVIVSYETCVAQAAVVGSYEWDLIICDEAHCLKNPDTERSKCLRNLNCQRRILLTGSPCQNNLVEFFEILDHANPGCLGTKEEFAADFVVPIVRSNEPHCTEEEHELGEECMAKLKVVASQFMLRRTAELLIPYLPSRQDVIVMCSAAELQKRVYEAAVSYWTSKLETGDGFGSGVSVLKAIMSLRHICNHPSLVKHESEPSEEFQPDEGLHRNLRGLLNDHDLNQVEHSGKLQVVCNILEQLWETNELKHHSRTDIDRVLIVSYFTKTLTLLENLCQNKKYKYLRFDGNTPQNVRMQRVNEFNKKDSDVFVFLLSAKAGGVGLNFTGASRLILFDLDWNPANDAQALGRVWRGDQARPVITYRLITAGTIEEKILQRQMKKTGLNPTSMARQDVKFSTEEIKDLFGYQDDGNVHSTHAMLQCECNGTGTNVDDEKEIDQGLFAQKEQDLSIHGIDRLRSWQHFAAHVDPSVMQELELLYAQDNVTFLYRNIVDSAESSNTS